MISAAELLKEVESHLASGGRCWMFLDYDGSLAEFAVTPDQVLPDPELIELLTQLSSYPEQIRVGVLSGRRLDQIRVLVPVAGILLAGTYGVEYQPPGGEPAYLVDQASLRPVIERILPRWQALVRGRKGFFIEDKGWALALHARWADWDEAQLVQTAASAAAEQAGLDSLRLVDEPLFLEVLPKTAGKGSALAALLDRFAWPGASLYYFGDDARDEEAFQVVQARGGTGVLIAPADRPSAANARLQSPAALRGWLINLITFLDRMKLNLHSKG